MSARDKKKWWQLGFNDGYHGRYLSVGDPAAHQFYWRGLCEGHRARTECRP